MLARGQAACEALKCPAATISAHTVDMADRGQIRRFKSEVEQVHGGVIHLLFNNAGIQIASAFDTMPEETFDKVMAVNLDGVVTATRVFWPMLLDADEAAVVNTSSVAGFCPPAAGYSTPYAVSKYAVRGFSEHLMMQCGVIAPHITVTSVHPGAIITEIAKKNLNIDDADMRFLDLLPPGEARELASLPDAERILRVKRRVGDTFERFGTTAAKAASIILDGVVWKRTRVLVGWDAYIMDWWIRLFPRVYNSRLGRALVMGTSVVGQHLVIPGAAAAAAALAYARWGRGRPKL